MRVHAIHTGHLTGNKTVTRGNSFGSLVRRRQNMVFPAVCFVLERPEGLVIIDTGLTAQVHVQWILRRFAPVPSVTADQEAGPAMQRAGLDPSEVRTVIVTHLDWDHIGGVGHFANAPVYVHREEHDFATSRSGRSRTQPRLWPDTFKPILYDFDPEPLDSFEHSAAIPGVEGIRTVPMPGHSPGHVGVAVIDGDRQLLFCGDHMLRVDWFEEDYVAGRKEALQGFFYPDAPGPDTTERIYSYTRDPRVVPIPAHDVNAHREAGFRVVEN